MISIIFILLFNCIYASTMSPTLPINVIYVLQNTSLWKGNMSENTQSQLNTLCSRQASGICNNAKVLLQYTPTPFVIAFTNPTPTPTLLGASNGLYQCQSGGLEIFPCTYSSPTMTLITPTTSGFLGSTATLTNALTSSLSSSFSYWTGYGGRNTCSGWTSTSGGGNVGTSSVTPPNYIDVSGPNCVISYNVLCICEMPSQGVIQSNSPTTPTALPSLNPTLFPTIPTALPSLNPTLFPTVPTKLPSLNPTLIPTLPTGSPTKVPTVPTGSPTLLPTLPKNVIYVLQNTSLWNGTIGGKTQSQLNTLCSRQASGICKNAKVMLQYTPTPFVIGFTNSTPTPTLLGANNGLYQCQSDGREVFPCTYNSPTMTLITPTTSGFFNATATLTNALTSSLASSFSYWTGYGGRNTCSGWTNTAGGGNVGTSSVTPPNYIDVSGPNCFINYNVLCICEMPTNMSHSFSNHLKLNSLTILVFIFSNFLMY